MLFCDQVFQFLELEESLYFTALDVEFHSAGKQPFTQNNLLEINFKHASAMTVNEKASLPTKAPNDLEELIRDYLYDNTERTEKCYKHLAEILFKDGHTLVKEDDFMADPNQTEKFRNNFLFTRFHHLFEYEACYYSYLVARICS